MKKVLIVLLILFICLVVGLGIFLATFNINKHLPFITGKIEEAIGNPARIGHVSLTWKNGIALEVRQLEIFDGEISPKKQPSLSVEAVRAQLSILPLLRQDIQVGNISVIRPDIRVIRTPEGIVRVAGLNPPVEKTGPEESQDASGAKSQGETAKGGASGAAPVAFFIDSLNIEKAQLLFIDAMTTPPVRVPIRDADIDLRNISLIQPIDFSAKFSLFSTEQNVSLKGRVKHDLVTQNSSLTDFNFKTDLSLLNMARVKEVLPELDPAAFPQKLAGKLVVEIDQLTVSPEQIVSLDGLGTFSDGLVQLAGAAPIENIQLDTVFTRQKLTFKSLSASAAGGKINGKAEVSSYLEFPQTAAELDVSGIRLETLVPPVRQSDPYVQGSLDGKVKLQITGFFDEKAMQTMIGGGNVTVTDGVVKNFNILREVFQKFSMLPGLVDRLKSRLGEEYLKKLEAKDTVLEEVALPFSLRDGAVSSDNLRIRTPSFGMTGRGNIFTDTRLALQLMLSIEKELSDAFIRSVQELSYLTNATGEMQLPVQIQGSINRPIVFPDLNYITQKLAVNKAQELIGGFLKPKTETPAEQAQTSETAETKTIPVTGPGSEETQTATTETAQTQQSTTKDIRDMKPRDVVNQLLKDFLES